MNALARRIRRLEDRRKPPPVRIPSILEIDILRNETIEEARSRFAERWGPIPPEHNFLVVPKRAETEEEDLAMRKRTERQQAALMIFARERPPSKEPKEPAQ